jgi:hypothetical protein
VDSYHRKNKQELLLSVRTYRVASFQLEQLIKQSNIIAMRQGEERGMLTVAIFFHGGFEVVV